MSAISSIRNGLRDFSKILWIGTLLINLLVVTTISLVIYYNHKVTVREAKLHTRNYSTILNGELTGLFRNIDNTLLNVVDQFEQRQTAGTLQDPDFQGFIEQQYSRVSEALGLRVINSHGNLAWGAGNMQSPTSNLADRPYFIRHRDDAKAGLVFSEPIMSRFSAQWVITLSRHLNAPNGDFAGITHFALPTTVLVKVLAKLDLGDQGNSGLWTQSTLIARHAKDDPHGSKTGARTPSPQLQALLKSGVKETYYSARSGIDGIARLYYFQQVGDYPLYSVVGLAEEDYLQHWKQNSIRMAGFGLLFILGTLILSSLAHSAWKRRQNSQNQLAQLSQWHELLLNSAGEGIYGIDMNGRCTFINPAALSMLGFSREEVIGHNQHQLFHHHQPDGSVNPEALCPVFNTLQDGMTRVTEDAFIRKNGEIFQVQVTSAAMRQQGVLVGAEVIFLDITQRKAMEAELKLLATTDALTGLANRRYFIQRMESELARLKRSEEPCCFMMMDLDFFKSINDTHGHAAGDKVLMAFAALSQSQLRSIDLIGRLGGEEFGLLLPNTTLAEALLLAERLRKVVEQTPIRVGEKDIAFTTSIGVAELEIQDESADSALARADKALYLVKQSGRNGVQAFQDSDGRSNENYPCIRLSWKPGYACGEAVIDQQHRQLFKLANRLLEQMVIHQNGDQQPLKKAFDELLDHVVQHFADEEAILLANHYPELSEHHEIHQRLITRAGQLRRQVDEHQLSLGELVTFLLNETIASHMLQEDRKFFPLFR